MGDIPPNRDGAHAYLRSTFGPVEPAHHRPYEESVPHFPLRAPGADYTIRCVSQDVARDWEWESQLHFLPMPRVRDVRPDYHHGLR